MRPDPSVMNGWPVILEDPFRATKQRQVKGRKGGYGPRASSDEQISVTGELRIRD